MKKFKKALVLLLALLTVFALISLAACSDSNSPDTDGETSSESGENNVTPKKSVTLVVSGKETKEYVVDITNISTDKGLVSILDVLKNEGKLNYGITDTFLDFVGEVSNNYETNEYIYIYTSVEKDFDVSEYKQTVKYKDKELTSAGIGALEMTIEDGAVIYVTTIKW